MQKRSIEALPKFIAMACDLSKDARLKLFKILSLLCENHLHPSLQTKKLLQTDALIFECRVDKSIRLIYDLSGDKLRCWYVGDHDKAISYGNSLTKVRRVNVEDIVIKVGEYSRQDSAGGNREENEVNFVKWDLRGLLE